MQKFILFLTILTLVTITSAQGVYDRATVLDFPGQPSGVVPSPPANTGRIYYNSTTNQFVFEDSSGANILPSASGITGITGGSPVIATNYFAEKVGPFYDPMAYGCVGDGVADDTTCFQNTVNAATSASGTVIVPGGKSFVLNRVALNSYANIDGNNDGFVNGALIIPKTDAAFVSATGTTVINEVKISGLHFVGGVNPIDIETVNGFYAYHLAFNNYTGNAITIVQGERHIFEDITATHTSANAFSLFAFADCSKSLFVTGCAAAFPSPDVDRQTINSVHDLGSLGSAGFAAGWFLWNGNIQGGTVAGNMTCFFSCTIGVINTPVLENGDWVGPSVDGVATVGTPEAIGWNIGTQCFNTRIASYNPSFGTTHMTTQIFFNQSYGCTLMNSQLSTSVDNATTFAVVHGNAFVNQDLTLLNVVGGYFDQNATGLFKVKIIGGRVTPSNALGGQTLSDQTNQGIAFNVMGDDNGNAVATGKFHVHRATGSFGYSDDFYSDNLNFATIRRLFTQGNAKLGGINTNAPTAQIAAQEFFIGIGTGGFPGGVTNANIAFEYSGPGGGFRHWLQSVHDPTAANNVLKFYINTAATAAGSSAPGTGNILGLTIAPSGITEPSSSTTDASFGSLLTNSVAACETAFAPTTLATGATITDTGLNCLPANSIIDAVVARVSTTITAACTGWELGDATTAARFSSNNTTLTAGTTTDAAHIGTFNNTGIASATTGTWQASAAKVRVTCAGGNPGAGAIRVIVYYHTWTAPTS